MPSFDMQFVGAFFSIVLIDLVLAGDNAVVIAMAVRNLPPRQRNIGIAVGAGAAVVLRIILTLFAAMLLDLPYVKLVGGVLIAWIGVKLLVDGTPDESGHKECSTMFQAMTTIIVADLVMSTDNIMAVAGASKGNFWLLLFGLGLSIPFVVFTSSLLTKLMDRYPVILVLGSAILGKVAAEMILGDPLVLEHVQPSRTALYMIEAAAAVAVVVSGKLWLRMGSRRLATADCGTRETRPGPDGDR